MPMLSPGFVRRRAISLATSLSVMATSFALAQDPKHDPEVHTARDMDEQQFLFDSDLAMSDMNGSVLTKPMGDIDRDLVGMMVPQHRRAIDMSRAEIKYEHNYALRQLTQRMVRRKKHELSIMRQALPTAANATPLITPLTPPLARSIGEAIARS